MLVAVVAFGSACGLPADRTPTPIDSSDVPFGLLAPRATTTALPQLGPTTPLFFVRGGHLVASRRHVSSDANVPEAALRELLLGPTPADFSAGDTTSIPSQTRLISLDVDPRSVAHVDLSKEFAGIGGSDQILAVAQIVLTLTAADQIRRVSFLIEGRPIEVPDGHGSLSSQPRAASDYVGLRHPS